MPLANRDFCGALSGLNAIGIVEHAATCHFLSTDSSVLAVGSRRLLSIYEVVDQDTAGASLHHVCHYTLFGVIQSLAVVRNQDKPDQLLLTFDKGKACIVAYDAALGPHRLRTEALFNFEENALGSDIRAESFASHTAGYGCECVGLVDPLARCAAVMLYGSHLGVVPLEDKDELQEMVEAEGTMETEADTDADVDADADADLAYEMRPGCFVLSLEEVGVNVGGAVRHAVFLEGRKGSPVLGVLHNTAVRTTSGRLMTARYTCCVSYIAVDLKNKAASTLLFQIDGLPHDAHAMVPAADGSLVVITGNAVLHLSASPAQWEALYANAFAVVSVDSQRIMRRTTARMAVRFDGARCAWLDSNRLLFSLRYGQIGLLDIDSMDFKLYGLTVQASCLCILANATSTFFFLGSNLADSVLVKYHLVDDDEDEEEEEEQWVADEERDLYGPGPSPLDSATSTREIPVDTSIKATRTLQLQVCDALACTGPMCSIAFGETPIVEGIEMRRAEEEADRLGAQGKHSLAADVLKHARENADAEQIPRYQVVGSYGRGADGGVCVFEPSGLRIDEKYESDVLFKLSDRDTGGVETLPPIKLWCPNEKLQLVSSISPPKTVIYVDYRRVHLKKNPTPFLTEQPTFSAALFATDKILQICSEAIVFARNTASNFEHIVTLPLADLFTGSGVERDNAAKLERAQVQDEDSLVLLEFSDGLVVVAQLSFTPTGELTHKIVLHTKQARCGTLFHKDGPKLAYIHSGLDMKLCVIDVTSKERHISEATLDKGEHVVNMTRLNDAMVVDESATGDASLQAFDSRRVVDLCIAEVGRVRGSAPLPHCAIHLLSPKLVMAVLLNNGDLLLYEVVLNSGNSGWRLYREPQRHVTRINEGGRQTRAHSTGYLSKCNNLQGHMGIFHVGAECTLWIYGSRGRFRTHRVEKDFAAIEVYEGKLCGICDTNRLVIGPGFALRSLRFDHLGLPMLKVPLKASITRLCHVAKALFIALASQDEPKEEDDLAVRASCSIKLLNGENWGQAEADQYSLMRHERPVCVNPVGVNTAFANATQPDLHTCWAIGTGFVSPAAEDVPCKGRILLFKVDIEQAKLSKAWTVESRQTRGPVTAVNSVDGKLLAALGSSPSSLRIYRYDVRSEGLTALSFYDTPFAAVSVDVVKNYILIGDIYRSVQLIRWRPNQRDFKLLGKHTREAVKVVDAKILLFNKSVPGILIADGDENLRVLNYHPEQPELQVSGAMHMASRGLQVLTAPHKLAAATIATQEGDLKALCPLDPEMFRQLMSLQTAIGTLLSHNAGLNPKGLRYVRASNSTKAQLKRKAMCDGDLIETFNSLPFDDQREIAQAMGTRPEAIMANIKAMQHEIHSMFSAD